MTREELKAAAVDMLDRAYIPYSHFPVGAALECSDGSVFTGCNIENASFGATNCAERTAFFSAVYAGERDFEAIAIVGGPQGEDTRAATVPCGPCGICRQVMREFCNSDFKIYLAAPEGGYFEATLEEMLPFSFGNSDLPK